MTLKPTKTLGRVTLAVVYFETASHDIEYPDEDNYEIAVRME